MASITRRPNGHRWVQFAYDGKRHTLRLGKVPDRQAAFVMQQVADLAGYRQRGISLPPELSEWLTKIDHKLYDKIARIGLAEKRVLYTLGELLTKWQASCNWKPKTHENVQPLIANLKKFFGQDTSLGEIDASRAAEFEVWLAHHGNTSGGPLAKATVSRRIRWAKQAFDFAVESKAIAKSPFKGIKSSASGEVNRGRDFFVNPELSRRVLDGTSDQEFRAIFAVARWAGLRCPSEVTCMVWDQVRWEDRTLRVKAPKTDDWRTTPLFETPFKELRSLWESCDPGELVFPRYALLTGAALTSKLQTLCRSIGEPLWQKPWQNMRSTCITEWLRKYLRPGSPYSIVDIAAWAGHSPAVMLKHYAQIVKELSASAVASPLNPAFEPEAKPEAVSDWTESGWERQVDPD